MRNIYDTIKCPRCGGDCERESVHNGVGMQHGPYGCPACGWSECAEYDCSNGPKEINGGIVDQFGGWTRKPFTGKQLVNDH